MSALREAYDRLFAAYGPQNWWPGESKFEILVGAVLVQNTAWRNVEKAIGNLREAGTLTAKKLYALPVEELSELIRPAGYYQVKAKRLRISKVGGQRGCTRRRSLLAISEIQRWLANAAEQHTSAPAAA